MAKQILLRVASVAGLLALAVALVGLDPLFAEGTGKTPAVSVDRSLKGDRLPVPNSTLFNVPDWQYEFGSQQEFGSQPRSAPRAQIPIGCDPAFSQIYTPSAANVYGRCVA